MSLIKEAKEPHGYFIAKTSLHIIGNYITVRQTSYLSIFLVLSSYLKKEFFIYEKISNLRFIKFMGRGKHGCDECLADSSDLIQAAQRRHYVGIVKQDLLRLRDRLR